MTDIKVFSEEEEEEEEEGDRKSLARQQGQHNRATGNEGATADADAEAASAAEQAEADRKSRAFVACANCRRAKAKCDLGDVNNPKDPPCARCRRRAIACEFLPSRRSGRMSYEARQAQKAAEEKGSSDTAPPPLPQAQPPPMAPSSFAYSQAEQLPQSSSNVTGMSSVPGNQIQNQASQAWQPSTLQMQPSIASTSSTTSIAAPSNTMNLHSSWPEEWQRFAEAKGLFESQASDPSPGATSHTSQEAPASAVSGSSAHPGSSTNIQSSLAPQTRNDPTRPRPATSKRKSRQKDEDRAEELAAANLQNPVDAMSLLVMAAGERKGAGAGQRGSPRKHARLSDRADNMGMIDSRGGDGDDTASSGSREEGQDGTGESTYQLSDFPLVKRGVLNTIEVFYYVNLFFTKVHPIFPLVPHHRIPRTEAQLTAFAKAEVHLTTVFILIASRLDQGAGNQARIHEQTWEYMQELITRLVFGEEVSVGALEALLLLSENPPRALANAGNHREDFAEENRMSWNIVGLAVRLGYMLSLDQISFHPIKNKGKETQDTADKHERERVAWTYCFLFDRQIAIRTGKAFWSRGPGLMFSGSSIDYFPSMRPIPGVQDDYAGLLQAYAEITQILQNSHDVLYPSKDRSIALVSNGEYHKHLDEFTRALNNYRTFWEPKQWTTFPLTECVWVTFHYVRLYIYAFAFQASVQRGIQQAQGSSVEAVKTGIFKRGTMNSPDARFLMESIEAACDMLRICTDRLHPSNVLQYLPWRYFLYFSYAGVFLLKAIFLNAVASHERRNTVRLLRRLIVCLAGTSSDPHHHAVRYARLLDSLLRTFSRGQDGVDTSSPHGHLPQAPSRRSEVDHANATSGQSPWPVSRPASPSLGQMSGRQQTTASAGSLPQGGPPAPFWGGNSQSNQDTGQGQAFCNSNLGDYRNFGGVSNFSSNFVMPGQNGQQSGAYGYVDASGGNTSYLQLANQNLGGGQGSGISPHSDSMVLPLEAYTNLLDDTTLDFWTALTNSQDWQSQPDNTLSGMFTNT